MALSLALELLRLVEDATEWGDEVIDVKDLGTKSDDALDELKAYIDARQQ
jgi:hypothetical protein